MIGRFKHVHALVVGDVMLDRFVYAQVSRISPEAPVPVLSVQREKAILGGAGNVARNVVSLGGQATLIGLKAQDRAGDIIDDLVGRSPGVENALLTSGDGQTIEKVRFIGNQQQVMRADYELTCPRPTAADAKTILDGARANMARCNVLVLSDYAKGLLGADLTAQLITLALGSNKPAIVDPKSRPLEQYDNATILTPNHHELSAAMDLPVGNDAEVVQCARALLARLPGVGAVLVTRGSSGMTLVPRIGDAEHIAARQRDIFDVSGAGDTVVAALALGMGAQGGLADCARLANIAAGIAVTKVGTAAVTADEIISELQARQIETVEQKIVLPERAADTIQAWRSKGQKVGFTNGCFDLVHPGHISLLSQARSKCDRLVVGLNSDASVTRLKGEGRPVQDEMARAIVLASLGMVDMVVIFSEDTPEILIRQLCPHLLVKGADYRIADIVGADFVMSYGGEVMVADFVPGLSTTNILTRIPPR